MNEINSLAMLDRRDEIILGILAGFFPLFALAAMIY